MFLFFFSPGVLGLREGEGLGLHDISHGLLCGHDVLQNLSKLHHEGITLLLQETVDEHLPHHLVLYHA